MAFHRIGAWCLLFVLIRQGLRELTLSNIYSEDRKAESLPVSKSSSLAGPQLPVQYRQEPFPTLT